MLLLPLARAALARPLLILALLAVGTAVAAKGLFRLELWTDGAAIHPQGDPVVQRTQGDREAFHDPDLILLLATARPGGPRLDTPQGFAFLSRLQAALGRFPGVEPGGVRSIVTFLDPPRVLRPLLIHTFFEEWSRGEAPFDDVLARLRREPMASGLYLSADGTAAAFYLPVGRRVGRGELLADLRRYLTPRRAAPFRLRLTGPVAAEADLGDAVLADLARLVPLMMAAVALLLALTLRTAGGVLIPLAQVVATLVWTLGLMGWAGVPVTLVTTVLPVLLMAMAMTDEIYLLERLRDHLAASNAGAPGGADGAQAAAGSPAAAARERVRRAADLTFVDLATPLVLISLATAAGFLSFLDAGMAPVRHLGLFTGIGLLLGMLFTFTLAPALVVTLPPRWLERRRGAAGAAAGEGELAGFERLTVRRPRAVALVTLGLLVLAVPGVLRLRVEDSWIDNFDPRAPLVTAARTFDAEFWGSYRFDVVCSGPAGYFWTPAGAALLAQVDAWAERAPHVGGVVSILPAFVGGARVLDLPPPLAALPAAAMRRVGMLVEILRIRLGLRELLALDGGRLRVRLLVKDADYGKARRLAAAFAAEQPLLAAGRPVDVHASGEVPEALAVVGAIVANQLRSIAWTALLIAAMLLAALRSARRTAVVLAPVVAATLLLFGGLGAAGVPLGIATSMFAALNLGAGVDFAVQYAFAYRRERRAGLAHAAAVAATLGTTGRGLRWNAVVLSLGIAVLGFSAIKPSASLGLLLALAMLVSYACTLALFPLLLRRWDRAR